MHTENMQHMLLTWSKWCTSSINCLTHTIHAYLLWLMGWPTLQRCIIFYHVKQALPKVI